MRRPLAFRWFLVAALLLALVAWLFVQSRMPAREGSATRTGQASASPAQDAASGNPGGGPNGPAGSPQIPGSSQTSPEDTNVARTQFYQSATTLAERREPTDDPALFVRTRLLRTQLHRPLVRSEETVRRGPGGDQLVSSLAMSADHVVVHYQQGTGRQALEAALSSEGTIARWIPRQNAVLLRLKNPDLDAVPSAIQRLADAANLYAEPDHVVFALATPNDPSYGDGSLWGMNNTGQESGTPDKDIDGAEGWDIRTSAGNTAVAVIDTGIRYTHQDLAPNMWINPGESGGGKETNGIDDDGNGYVDDVYGINTITGSGNPMDDNRHGSHCAGTIAGRGNNGLGVAGVAWTAKLMAVKFLSAQGSGFESDAAEGITYAVSKGARILSNSWGGGGFSQLLYDAIQQSNAQDAVFVAAAGNDHADLDRSPVYPASYPLPNVLVIAAYDRTGSRAWFSNYGVASVHVGAPGVNTLSCSIASDSAYELLSGTSMATPHVAGILALVREQFPSENNLQVINRVVGSADLSLLQGSVVAGGANLAAALSGAAQGPFNDAFTHARNLGTRAITTFAGNELATKEPGEPAHAGNAGGASVWFSWTSSFNRPVHVSLSDATFDTLLAVHQGETVGNLTLVVANDDAPVGSGNNSSLTFNATQGQTYKIAVDGKAGAMGTFLLSLDSSPANDDFATAEVLSGTGATLRPDNTGAGKEVGEPRHGGLFGGSSLWYRFTAPYAGRLSAQQGAGSAQDIGISIYSGNTITALTELGSARPTDDADTEKVARADVAAGQTYYLGVDTPNGAEGWFFLSWAFASNDIRFQTSEINVAENVPAGVVAIPVDRFTGSGAGACSVSWFTSSPADGAVPGLDFNSASGVLNWGVGESATRTLQVPILDNAQTQAGRIFYVTLTNPANGAYLGPISRINVTITDDETAGLPPGAAAYAFDRATSNAITADGSVPVRIVRGGNATAAGSVRVRTTNGTLTAGAHFATLDQVLAFGAGETAKTVVVTLLPGTAAGTFGLELLTPSGPLGVIGTPGTHTVTLSVASASGMAVTGRANVSDAGNETAGFDALNFTASADLDASGRFVVFATPEAIDPALDLNSTDDIYLRDRLLNRTQLVSVNRFGLAAGRSTTPKVSDDGRRIAFESGSPDLLDGDTNGKLDIFVWDRLARQMQRVSLNSNGEQAAVQYINLDEPQYTDCTHPEISGDGNVVVFRTDATNLDVLHADTDWDPDLFARVLSAGTTEFVSVGNGWKMSNYASEAAALSTDGSRIAFISAAPYLVDGDTNFTKPDVFLRNRTNQTTVLVSRTDNGSQSQGWGLYSVAISGNGSRVAFSSPSEDYVTGDTNGGTDIFMRDLNSSTTTRISITSAGAQLTGSSASPSLSSDGRYLLFRSSAVNGASGDANGADDVFVKDLQTGGLYLVSRSLGGGGTANGGSDRPRISRGGSQTLFFSAANNLVASDLNGVSDLFVAPNPALGAGSQAGWRVPSVSFVKSVGGPAQVTLQLDRTGSLAGAVWADFQTVDLTALAGRDYVGISGRAQFADGASTASVTIPVIDPIDVEAPRRFRVDLAGFSAGLGPGGASSMEVQLIDGGRNDLVLITRASNPYAGGDPETNSLRPSVSANGMRVVFHSASALLVAGDTNNDEDVFMYDRSTGLLSVVSRSSAGVQGDSYSRYAVISGDGNTVVFASNATNFGGPGTNGKLQLHARNLLTGNTTMISVTPGGAAGNGDSMRINDGGLDEGRGVGIGVSYDGRFVAFESAASDLVAGDTNGGRDVFLRDRTLGTTRRASIAGNGTQGTGGEAIDPTLDASGTRIAFVSTMTNLVAGDTNAKADVFLRNDIAGSTIMVQRSLNGTVANGDAASARISGNGQFVAFHSKASNLVAGDTNGWDDVFVWSNATNTTERVSVSTSGNQTIPVTVNFFGTTTYGESWSPSISSDGRFVVFSSRTRGLVPDIQFPIFFGFEFPNFKVFVRDRTLGITSAVIPVSANSDGQHPVVSADGQVVGFQSWAASFNPVQSGTWQKIYLGPNPAFSIPSLSYGAWAAGYPGTSDPDADADADGLSNRAEYLLGSHPLSGARGPYPALEGAPAAPEFVFLRNPLAREAAGTVETSVDLWGWAPVRSGDAAISITPASGGLESVRVQWLLPEAHRFFRLRVDPQQP